MILADHLSHNVNPEVSKVSTIPDLNLEVSALELNASPSKLECITKESERDPQMLMLKELIIQGWPKYIKQSPLPLHSFWNFRDELSIIDGIVVKGNHIVIPKFQPELLSLLHDDSHLGIDKCIQWAKGSIYWPNITEDIKSIVYKCEKCLADCRHNQKEPYIPIDIPIVACPICISRQNIHDCNRPVFQIPSGKAITWGEYKIGTGCLERCLQ